MTATYTTPRTWVAGELVTASLMNTHVRDNLDWLKTPSAANDLAGGISTTSASLVDITGSSVTFTSNGGGFDVVVVCTFSCTTISTVNISLNVDGATERTFPFVTSVATYNYNGSFVYHVAALTAGSHTFKLQTSTGSGTATLTVYQLYVVERGA